jgi:hypothetical protein
LGCFGSKVPYN